MTLQPVRPLAPPGEGSSAPRSRQTWLAVWFLLALLSLAYGLGGYPLIDPDEGRNAEVAREITVSGRCLLPTLNGVPYLDKPFFYFAASAALMEVAGVSEVTARTTSLLFGIASVLLTGWFAGRLFGRGTVVVAATAAATAPLAIAYARAVIPDAMQSLFVTLSIVAFYLAVEARLESQARLAARRFPLWTALAWTAIALGILAKGPVALILPILVAAPYAAWRRASAAIWHPVALLPLALLVGPFLWLLTREFPGFLRYVLLVESLERFAGSGLQRVQPLWFLPAVFCVGLFPWWPLALGAVRRRADGSLDPRIVFCLLWLLLPVVFFSLSKSKMPQYLLPLVPAAALMTAAWWRAEGARGARPAAALWAAFGAVMLAFSARLVAIPEDTSSEVASAIPGTVLALGSVTLAGALVAWLARARGRKDVILAALSLPCVLLTVVTLPITRIIAEDRSSRRLARQIAPFVTPDTEILGAEVYVPSLSFYLEREYPFVSQDGRQLRSNFVLRHYDSLSGPDSKIRRPAALERALAGCRRTTLFLTSSRYPDLVEKIERAGSRRVGRHNDLLAFIRTCPPEPDGGPGRPAPRR